MRPPETFLKFLDLKIEIYCSIRHETIECSWTTCVSRGGEWGLFLNLKVSISCLNTARVPRLSFIWTEPDGPEELFQFLVPDAERTQSGFSTIYSLESGNMPVCPEIHILYSILTSDTLQKNIPISQYNM